VTHFNLEISYYMQIGYHIVLVIWCSNTFNQS